MIKKNHQVEPAPEVFDFIIFKGNDIADLTVCDQPGGAAAAQAAPAPAQVHALRDDSVGVGRERWGGFPRGAHTGPGGCAAAGYVFVISNETKAKVKERQLVGLGKPHLQSMKSITGETQLFLYNFDTRELHGPVWPRGKAGMDIDRWFCEGRFRAQIEIDWPDHTPTCTSASKQRHGPRSRDEVSWLLDELIRPTSSAQPQQWTPPLPKAGGSDIKDLPAAPTAPTAPAEQDNEAVVLLNPRQKKNAKKRAKKALKAASANQPSTEFHDARVAMEEAEELAAEIGTEQERQERQERVAEQEHPRAEATAPPVEQWPPPLSDAEVARRVQYHQERIAEQEEHPRAEATAPPVEQWPPLVSPKLEAQLNELKKQQEAQFNEFKKKQEQEAEQEQPRAEATVAAAPEPPITLCCPITQELLEEPVLLDDGHTYERAPIEQWLKNKTTSPVTGEELSSTKVTPNYMARTLAQEWKEQQL